MKHELIRNLTQNRVRDILYLQMEIHIENTYRSFLYVYLWNTIGDTVYYQLEDKIREKLYKD